MQWEGFSYNGQALHVHDCVYNVHSRMPYRRIHQIHAGTVLSTLNSHIIKIKPGKKTSKSQPGIEPKASCIPGRCSYH